MTVDKKPGLTRRQFLKNTAVLSVAAVASAPFSGFPMIWKQNIKNVTLRQFGTGVSNLNDIARKCKEDLGINLEMTALDSDAVTQRAVTQPKSYDLADIEYWICKKVFPAGVLQPMDVSKIRLFDKIVLVGGKEIDNKEPADGDKPKAKAKAPNPSAIYAARKAKAPVKASQTKPSKGAEQ